MGARNQYYFDANSIFHLLNITLLLNCMLQVVVNGYTPDSIYTPESFTTTCNILTHSHKVNDHYTCIVYSSSIALFPNLPLFIFRAVF